MPMPIFPVAPVAPPARQFAPRPVGPVSIVGTSVQKPARPGIVLATVKPGWPAPTSTAVIPTTAKAPLNVGVRDFNAGRIVSESIFGGPVTVGDPAVTTLTVSPYTDKVVTSYPKGLPSDEGWTDIFGANHGARVPESAQVSRRNRGGAFGTRVSLGEPPSLAQFPWKPAVAVAAVVALVYFGTRKK